MSTSTPKTRAAKRDAIAAKFADPRRSVSIRFNPAVVAATAIVAAAMATGWVEGLPL